MQEAYLCCRLSTGGWTSRAPLLTVETAQAAAGVTAKFPENQCCCTPDIRDLLGGLNKRYLAGYDMCPTLPHGKDLAAPNGTKSLPPFNIFGSFVLPVLRRLAPVVSSGVAY